MICKECGAETADSTLFCPSCGAKLQSMGNSGKATPNSLIAVTIILFAVQVVSYLIHIAISKVNINDSYVFSNPEINAAEAWDAIMKLSESGGGLKLNYIYFLGEILFIVGVVFIIALISKKQGLFKAGAIVGIVISFGLNYLATIPYISFFIMLLLIIKGKNIPTVLPIVLEIVGAIILFMSNNMDYATNITLLGMFWIGLAAGTLAYALLVSYCKKMFVA